MIHRFLPCHTLNWQRYLYAKHFFEQFGKQSLINFNYIVYIYERELHINLCKFRLSVCTKVFVTETFGKLEIAVTA